jgi:TPR repeat protein
MLRLGDVSAARMLFVRAAELGIGIAALKVADTYDPAFLAEHNLRGIKADPVEAETWYRKAQAMGEPQAEEHLKSLERRRLLATH